MRLSRRTILCGALMSAVCAAPSAVAHTPFRQWVVYRKKHLLIGSSRDDAGSYATAKVIADYLGEHLPEADARVARAPAAHRLASLMATDQMDVAVLAPETAAQMAAGDGVYAAYGELPLRLLAHLADGRLLVAHSRIPDDHAALLIEALVGSDLAPAAEQGKPAPIPWHNGRNLPPIVGAPAPPASDPIPGLWQDPRRSDDMWAGAPPAAPLR